MRALPDFIAGLAEGLREKFAAIFKEDVPAVEQAKVEALEERRMLSISSVNITAPSSVNEAATFGITVSAQSSATYISGWEVNWGDGSAVEWVANSGGDDPGAAVSKYVTHSYADGSVNRTISAKAFETISYSQSYASHGAYTDTMSYSRSLTVSNVAPTISLSGNSPNANETFTLDRTYSDPGSDTVAQWKIDWGDGSALETVTGNPSSFTHTYTQNGLYSIVATAIDEDCQTSAFYGANIGQINITHKTIVDDGEIVNSSNETNVQLRVRKLDGSLPDTGSSFAITLVIGLNFRNRAYFLDAQQNKVYERTVTINSTDDWFNDDIVLYREDNPPMTGEVMVTGGSATVMSDPATFILR